jgi:tRNA nucleotidyltransferase/poly(A) polymerase
MHRFYKSVVPRGLFNSRNAISRMIGTATKEPQSNITIQLSNEERELFAAFSDMVKEEKTGTTIRVAGGWVRDKLLKTNGKVDIDIALDNMSGKEFALALKAWNTKTSRLTSLTEASSVTIDPVTGQPILKVAIIKSNPKQSKHLETATMELGKFSVDFVNLRAEMYTSASRIPIAKIGTAHQDAYRRDLTINSLFYNINTGVVEDLTGRGIRDLSNGLTSTPLAPLVTLRDDPLRALRAVRFTCRFGFEMCEKLVKAASDPSVHVEFDKKISRERVCHETTLMLGVADPYVGTRAAVMLGQLGLLPLVLLLPRPTDSEPVVVRRKGSSDVPDTPAIEMAVAQELKTFHSRAVNLLLLLTAISHSPANRNPASQFTAEFQRLANSIKKSAEPSSMSEVVYNACVAFACLTFPGIGLECDSPPPRTKRRGLKPAGLPDYILRHHLKLPHKQYDAIDAIQQAALLFGRMIEELIEFNKTSAKSGGRGGVSSAAAATAVGSGSATEVMQFKGLQRERVGLAMREAGPLFLPALSLAVASSLSKRLLAAQSDSSSGDAMPDLDVVNMITFVLSETIYGSTESWKADYFRGNASGFYDNLLSGPYVEARFGDEVMQAGRDLIASILAMNLHEDYSGAPVLNGGKAKQILTNIPPGASFGEVKTEILRWGMSTPRAQRTEDALAVHLKSKYAAWI